jgi:hypothetical protein
MIAKFLFFGLVGISIHLIVTAFIDTIKKRKLELTGEASVILIPIYGIIGIIYPLIAVHLGKNSWYLRGIVYMLTFYVFQFAIGLLLRKIDLCPWKYSGALSINGLIRLQDAPLWFFLGLGIEFVYPLARAFSHVAI